jgi:Glucose-6-phosphate dehydrogenase, NAD binding domain
MSTTIAPGGADSGAAPAREQAAVASASRAGRARGSVPRPDNHVIVVFGATSDLAHRKLLPGLFHLATAGLMPDRYQIIGVSPQDIAGEQFRELARQAITDFGTVEPTVTMLGAAGLAGGSRVIIEKPFGTDLASARALNQATHAVFGESRVFTSRAGIRGRSTAQEHVMGLSHYQQHQLHRIETGLLRSDPQLTAMLGISGRLSAGQVMPAWEQVPTRRQSIRRAASLTVTAAIVVAEAIVLLLRAVLALLIAAGARQGHRLPAPGPERTRRGRGADGRPDPAGQG